MYYEVTGQQPWGGRGVITISVETAKGALGIARQWAGQGIRNIAITTPKGESLDLDRFGTIVSTKEGTRTPTGGSGLIDRARKRC